MAEAQHLAISKTINDAVHGSIGLTQPEVDIVSSPAFQRLRNVKQLGLAALVYPGANYSRFAHSIGACHLVGRILDAIQRNTGNPFSTDTVQRYRLAALLHDIGHYPFSHVVENVVENVYKKSGYCWRIRRTITFAGKAVRGKAPNWTKTGLLP
jgi:HD superfamily phosphohydrolase